MNRNLLIDALVRQTMILIAHFATSGGTRTPLAHIADEIFLSLAKELQTQGLGRKVIADMFGLTLRSYHAKVRRVTESQSQRGQSLWEAVTAYLEEKKMATRAEVLHRFRRDDGVTVAGILTDLVDSGFAFRSGSGDNTLYRLATAEELGALFHASSGRFNALIWVTLFRYGPMTVAALTKHFPILDAEQLTEALTQLVDEGHVQRTSESESVVYSSAMCVITAENEEGWEAAIWDHFQAMVTAICTKARAGQKRSRFNDHIGGSTYHFQVSDIHPLKDEVLDFLQLTRNAASALRKRVDEYNAESPSAGRPVRVTFYAGQTVLSEDSDNE